MILTHNILALILSLPPRPDKTASKALKEVITLRTRKSTHYMWFVCLLSCTALASFFFLLLDRLIPGVADSPTSFTSLKSDKSLDRPIQFKDHTENAMKNKRYNSHSCLYT